MAKTTRKKSASIEDLKFDEHNINRGTEEGADLIMKSLDEVGYGKSIVVDKDNNILAGNQVTAAAIKKGNVKLRFIETNGDELVVVKRNDISINTVKGAKLKILDNTTSKKNYVQDANVSEVICKEYNLDAGQYGLEIHQLQQSGEIKKIPLVPFKKTHVLLSFPPEKLVQIQSLLEQIIKIDGIEFEQSSN